MSIERYDRPVAFYTLSTFIPWAFWFAAAYVSHLTPMSTFHEVLIAVCGVLGLFGPTVIAF